jgi:ABC-type bacteriocin/lantibiotic exporter with double-glycine peptidase domain
MTLVKDSIFSTFKRTFSVLNDSQLRSSRVQVIYSIVYALLELVSVAILIPLIAQLSPSDSRSLDFLSIQFPEAENYFLLLIVAIASIFLIKNGAIMVIASKQAHFISNISTELSLLLFNRFYKQSWLNYISVNTEDYIRKIKEVPSDFAHHVLHNFIKIITDVFTGIIIIAFLSFTEIRIIFVLVGMLLPVWIIYLIFKQTVILNINKSFREITPVTSSILAQSVESFTETRLYGKENYFLKKYSTLRRTSSDYLAKLKAASHVPSLFFEVAGVIVILGLLYYTIQTGEGSSGLQLIALVTIAVYKIFPILNRVLNGIVQVMAYRYTVKELELALDANEEKVSKVEISFNSQIVFKNISFAYPDKASLFELKGIRLEIQKGDFIVITGPSGSGKTTLLNVMAGLLEGYSGEMSVDDITILPGKHSWNCQLSLVPQTPVILQDTIRHNIAFGADEKEIDDGLVSAAAKDAVIYDFINELPLGFNTMLGENGLTISGGQRQCIALARALYNKPQLLLLDEPTNQLDEVNKKNLLQSLKNSQSKGLTIILVTHDLIALNYCSKHIELRNGTIENTTPL